MIEAEKILKEKKGNIGIDPWGEFCHNPNIDTSEKSDKSSKRKKYLCISFAVIAIIFITAIKSGSSLKDALLLAILFAAVIIVPVTLQLLKPDKPIVFTPHKSDIFTDPLYRDVPGNIFGED